MGGNDAFHTGFRDCPSGDGPASASLNDFTFTQGLGSADVIGTTSNIVWTAQFDLLTHSASSFTSWNYSWDYVYRRGLGAKLDFRPFRSARFLNRRIF
jgi:hypothetical protein